MTRAMAVTVSVEFARAILGNKEPAFEDERLFINFKNGGLFMSEKKYEKAVAERVVFDNSDVITTSGMIYCHISFDQPGAGCADGVHENYMNG